MERVQWVQGWLEESEPTGPRASRLFGSSEHSARTFAALALYRSRVKLLSIDTVSLQITLLSGMVDGRGCCGCHKAVVAVRSVREGEANSSLTGFAQYEMQHAHQKPRHLERSSHRSACRPLPRQTCDLSGNLIQGAALQSLPGLQPMSRLSRSTRRKSRRGCP